jgi:hypothetical protein
MAFLLYVCVTSVVSYSRNSDFWYNGIPRSMGSSTVPGPLFQLLFVLGSVDALSPCRMPTHAPASNVSSRDAAFCSASVFIRTGAIPCLRNRATCTDRAIDPQASTLQAGRSGTRCGPFSLLQPSLTPDPPSPARIYLHVRLRLQNGNARHGRMAL